LVLYYRTGMLACGSVAEEIDKQVASKKKVIREPATT
jgi:hypothetical protein